MLHRGTIFALPIGVFSCHELEASITRRRATGARRAAFARSASPTTGKSVSSASRRLACSRARSTAIPTINSRSGSPARCAPSGVPQKRAAMDTIPCAISCSPGSTGGSSGENAIWRRRTRCSIGGDILNLAAFTRCSRSRARACLAASPPNSYLSSAELSGDKNEQESPCQSDQERCRVAQAAHARAISCDTAARHGAAFHRPLSQRKKQRHLCLRELRQSAVRFRDQIRFGLGLAELLCADFKRSGRR